MASFWKPEACGQTVLPDRSVLIGQKIGGKCQNSNVTFWVIFKQCAGVGTNSSMADFWPFIPDRKWTIERGKPQRVDKQTFPTSFSQNC